MQIVRQFNNTYATAYLLEKAGDIHGAFQLLLEVRITFPSENGNFLFIPLLLVREHTKPAVFSRGGTKQHEVTL